MVATRLGFNEVDIDEVMHRAMITMWKGWGQANPSTLQGWGNQVVYNVILEFKRSRRQNKNSCYSSFGEFQYTDNDGAAFFDPGDFIEQLRDARDGHYVLENARKARVIIDSIRRSGCPVLARLALGEGPANISRELGITIPTAKAIIYKFRSKMKREIGGRP